MSTTQLPTADPSGSTSSLVSDSTAAVVAKTSSTDPSATQPMPYFDRLGVLPWQETEDTDADTGHDPRSAYVETFWLPLLGPSTTLLLRRLAEEFDSQPDGFEIDCAAVSREIGLGNRLTCRSPFVRTVERCVKFSMAQLTGELLYVRRKMPRLSPRQVAKLSDRLQQLHEAWSIDALSDGERRRIEFVRATHLARTLLALGETPTAAERQLHTWRFHPSIAWHAVQWAQTDHAEDVQP